MTKAKKAYLNNKVALPVKEDLTAVVRGQDMDELLFDLLTQKTPHPHEEKIKPLISKVVKDCPAIRNWKQYMTDEKGNLVVSVGQRKKHRTMFSCHMDTVQRHVGTIDLMKTADGFVSAQEDGKAAILGADDKLGVYICLKLIKAEVPGLYVFHIGEERGGIGSSALSVNTKFAAGFKAINRCIAFDRMGTTSIITHQRGGRCCSNKFAEAFADALNKEMPAFNVFKKDDTGTFTDSANYTDIIGECTNLSVGYSNQHSTAERFDLLFLEHILIPALLKLQWADLPTERKEGEEDKSSFLSYSMGYKNLNRKNYSVVPFSGGTPISDSKSNLHRKTFDSFDWSVLDWGNVDLTEMPLFDFSAATLPKQCPANKQKMYIYKMLMHHGHWKAAEMLEKHYAAVQLLLNSKKESVDKLIDDSDTKYLLEEVMAPLEEGLSNLDIFLSSTTGYKDDSSE